MRKSQGRMSGRGASRPSRAQNWSENMLHRIAGIALVLVVAAAAIADAAPIEPGKPVKIMPLGDSITFGAPDPGYGGYRRLLATLLAADGYVLISWDRAAAA